MTLSGIAQRLITEGVISKEAALVIAEKAQEQDLSFLQYTAVHQNVDPKTLALAVAHEFGIPFLDLTAFDREYLPKNLVSEKLIRHHMALPLFQRGNTLFLAMSDPTNLLAEDDIQFQTGLNTEILLVAYDQLVRAVEDYIEGDEVALARLEDEEADSLDTNEPQRAEPSSSTDDAPIVKFVNKILLDAIKTGVSDIHFEPYERNFRIRYRTDGILHEVIKPPFSLRNRITSRLKVMAHLDISERRIPQDGSIKLKVSKNRTIDFRVNTLPTIWGEKVVLRVLDSSAARIGIDELGFAPDQKKVFKKALGKPQGMILVTGPTGSGKTVTLYTGLNILNTLERNISTAEDPVEINLEGINQVSINTKVGLDFASALRAFLRQDPDIIMVGEIRDLETAEIAIKAAQTGHLVLSTLHTNSAAETLSRLGHMGIPAFNIASSVSLIIAQRLARKLCNYCKKPVTLPESTLIDAGFKPDDITQIILYGPEGCEHCHGGYRGRIGIYELLPISSTISQLIMSNANSIDIAQQSQKEGFSPLRISGLNAVKAGLTSLEEINRITVD